MIPIENEEKAEEYTYKSLIDKVQRLTGDSFNNLFVLQESAWYR